MTDPTDDQVFLDALTRVPSKQWDALWAAVEAVQGEPEHAKWTGGVPAGPVGTTDDGRPVFHVEYPIYSEAVETLLKAIRDAKLVIAFDWMSWDGLGRYEGGAGMNGAPVADALRVITATIRAERFGDGAIEAALDDGILMAALGRIRRWFDEERAASGR